MVQTTVHDRALSVLKQVWGYEAFRPGQWRAILAVLEGRDVLGILPTGGGKSLCYQVPALMSEGLTVVVSPLISLMEDQTARLKELGVSAVSLAGAMGSRALDQALTDAKFGRFQVLYVSPERLQSDLFRERAAGLNIGLLAVDEAHCVSEWGHDFRPEYRRIPEIYDRIGRPPVIALTATATPKVADDIARNLDLRSPETILQGFDRPNLVFSVFRTSSKRKRIREILGSVEGRAILYAQTRRSVEEWGAKLATDGESVAIYHAGLSAEERICSHAEWRQGEARIIVATNAFGMGIDQADVRCVVHVGLPFSLESYYQEAGRAGRDGAKAYATLLFDDEDIRGRTRMLRDACPRAAEIRSVYDTVCSMAGISYESTPDAPFQINVRRVGQVSGLPAARVRHAIGRLEREGLLIRLTVRSGHMLLKLDAETITRLRSRIMALLPDTQTLVNGLLRYDYTEGRKGWTMVDLSRLATQSGLAPDVVTGTLDLLSEQGLVETYKADGGDAFSLPAPRERRLQFDGRRISRMNAHAASRLKDMVDYAQAETCRRRRLLAHFGEYSIRDCGRCDICMGRHKRFVPGTDNEAEMRDILRAIMDNKSPYDDASGISLPVWRREQMIEWLGIQGYLDLKDHPNELPALTDKGRCALNVR